MIAAEGDISTDLLSPGAEAHSRSDRELHGRCMCTPEDQQLIVKLQKENPGKKVMMIAEKGTMGVGSSRMSASTTLRCGPVSKPVLMSPLLTTHPLWWHKRHLADFFDHRRCDRRYRFGPEKLG